MVSDLVDLKAMWCGTSKDGFSAKTKYQRAGRTGVGQITALPVSTI